SAKSTDSLNDWLIGESIVAEKVSAKSTDSLKPKGKSSAKTNGIEKTRIEKIMPTEVGRKNFNLS
ncbi:MAG TPA: hypothetical protein VMW74_08940, partial [Nitrosopumilaceae archaeon]|nr:hypothetical protein [Nitrosopumilaceae archaeon]